MQFRRNLRTSIPQDTMLRKFVAKRTADEDETCLSRVEVSFRRRIASLDAAGTAPVEARISLAGEYCHFADGRFNRSRIPSSGDARAAWSPPKSAEWSLARRALSGSFSGDRRNVSSRATDIHPALTNPRSRKTEPAPTQRRHLVGRPETISLPLAERGVSARGQYCGARAVGVPVEDGSAFSLLRDPPCHFRGRSGLGRSIRRIGAAAPC